MKKKSEIKVYGYYDVEHIFPLKGECWSRREFWFTYVTSGICI